SGGIIFGCLDYRVLDVRGYRHERHHRYVPVELPPMVANLAGRLCKGDYALGPIGPAVEGDEVGRLLLVAAPINRDEGDLGGLKELLGDPLDLQAVQLVFGILREACDELV